MSLQSELEAAMALIGADAGKLVWMPNEPTAEDGKSYAPFYTNGGWQWSEVPPGAPPLDLFVDGWTAYPFSQIESVLGTGTAHAAVSIGPQTPTVGGVSFEQSATNTADTGIPGAGWSGTNWLIERESSAPSPSGQGNATGRLEVTAFADLPDPSFGTIAGVEDLCISALRRNSYITIDNLTIGNRYYVGFFFGSYPNSLTRATKIDPSNGGDSIVFGVDGVGAILERGIRRFGFTATATSISFQKYGPDTVGSYCNGFFCLDQGTP